MTEPEVEEIGPWAIERAGSAWEAPTYPAWTEAMGIGLTLIALISMAVLKWILGV
jgi:hypothetical protein